MAKIHLYQYWGWYESQSVVSALCGRNIFIHDNVDSEKYEDTGALDICITCRKTWRATHPQQDMHPITVSERHQDIVKRLDNIEARLNDIIEWLNGPIQPYFESITSDEMRDRLQTALSRLTPEQVDMK